MTILNEIEKEIFIDNIENAFRLIMENEEEYRDNSEYWNLRAVLCLKCDEYEVAIECLTYAITLDPENSENYYNYAYALDKIGNRSDAALYYGLAYRYGNAHVQTLVSEIYNDTNNPLSEIFRVAANNKKKKIIVLSSCGWGDIYQRMHHISRSLAKYGNEVCYIEPSINIQVNEEEFTIRDLNKFTFQDVKVVDGVKIYQPQNIVKNEDLQYSNVAEFIQELINIESLDTKDIVIITYLPHHINIINLLVGQFTHIYDCVDDHTDLEYAFWGHKFDSIWERQLMDKADSIITTSVALYLRRTAIEQRENVFLLRNAVNEGDFGISNSEIPSDLRDIPEPRIVYSGAIYDWFDIDLFYEVVKSNPDKSFVVIGFGKDELFKEKCPNLYLLGVKKHSDLINYLQYMDIGIVPFKSSSDIIINCDPIKHYEYISCNLPVITTLMPESAIGKVNTFLADSKEEFNRAIHECLNSGKNYGDNHSFLVENSWNYRAALICRIADKAMNELYTREESNKLTNKLFEMHEKYNSSIFSALYGMAINTENSQEFEKILKHAYSKQQIKFIESLYLVALFNNNKINSFVEVVMNSNFIKDEIKDEIKYRVNAKNMEGVLSLLYFCMNDITEFLRTINQPDDIFVKQLDRLYIKYIFDEITNKELKHALFEMNHVEPQSPLYLYLKSEMKDS